MNLHPGRLQNQYTRVSNLSMFARMFAEDLPGDAPAIILVHSLVLASRYMIPTAELLASKYRVYVPDFPGYGDSDQPGEVLELPELADVLCLWMDAVGIKLLPNGKLNVIHGEGHTLNYSKPVELSRVCDEYIQKTVADLTTGSVQ